MKKEFRNLCASTAVVCLMFCSLVQAKMSDTNIYEQNIQIQEVECKHFNSKTDKSILINPYASYYIDTCYGDIEALGNGKIETCSFLTCGRDVSKLTTKLQLQMKSGNRYINVGPERSKNSYSTYCNGFDLIYSGLVPGQIYRVEMTFTASDAMIETRQIYTDAVTAY